MDSGVHLEAISTRIAALKQIAQELQTLGADIPCLARNTTRILASLKMLEIGFTDVMDLGSATEGADALPRLSETPTSRA